MTAEAARVLKSDQVREQLEELIQQMRPGEPLPPERELATRLGVARMTLRRAVDALIVDHRLLRRPGAGTFVAPPRVDQRLSATSFSADMRSRGMAPGAHTVFARHQPAGMMLASTLEIAPAAKTLHVRRLRTADGEPMALEDLHVPADLVPGLTGEALEDSSFYSVLQSRYGVRIAAGTQSVEPHLTSPEEAELLHAEPGAVAFLFERTSRADNGRVVEFVRSVYRGDRYRIVVDLTPTTSTPTNMAAAKTDGSPPTTG